MAPEGELLKGPRWGRFDLCEGPKESGVGLLKLIPVYLSGYWDSKRLQ